MIARRQEIAAQTQFVELGVAAALQAVEAQAWCEFTYAYFVSRIVVGINVSIDEMTGTADAVAEVCREFEAVGVVEFAFDGGTNAAH